MTYKNIDVATFVQLKEKNDHVVLDVRAAAELAEGKVPGSTMINFFDADFADQIAQLDKTKTYLLYCRSGNRSGQACALMSEMGFGQVYNLIGGIGAWNAIAPVALKG